MDERIVTRFWSRVQRDTPEQCWEWQAGKTGAGYGHFRGSGAYKYAHRVAYELTHGPIPAGMHICHHCDNPSCCNPAHLFIGTPKDNMQDRDRKGRGRYPSNPNRRHYNKGAGKPSGERHGLAKLTSTVVRNARRLHAEGAVVAVLARQYNVSYNTLWNAIHRVTWKAVE